MPPKIRFDRTAVREFCKKHNVRRLSLFGSVLRDDFGPKSDVDVLVEFEEGHKVTLFDMVDMEEELSAILGGRRVDLRTPQDLSHYFRDDVARTAEVQYATG